ncbi:MAG: hypothetical protein ABSH38_13445, partial [Verrucomicrobiota bacterium]
VIFAAAAKLFTVGCGAKFAALTLPPMNNFGRPIRARVLPDPQPSFRYARIRANRGGVTFRPPLKAG